MPIGTRAPIGVRLQPPGRRSTDQGPCRSDRLAGPQPAPGALVRTTGSKAAPTATSHHGQQRRYLGHKRRRRTIRSRSARHCTALAPDEAEQPLAGTFEAGLAKTCQMTMKARWSGLSLSWPHTSGLSQRPAFLRRTMEVRQPSGSGPCCPFSLPLRWREGREQAARTTPRSGRFPARGIVSAK